jgi:fructokinase
MVFDVAALGELLIDFTPAGVSPAGMRMYERNPGGAPANVLAMITKLGGSAAFIGKVGDDEFGRFLEQMLRDARISVSGLVKDASYPTTLAFVHLSEKGDRSFSFYRREGADIMLDWQDVDRELIRASSIFHFGSVSLSMEPCRTTVHKALNFAKSNGKVISFDPNYRPFLWTNQTDAKQEIEKLIPSADIVKVSEEEMILLTGTNDIEKGASMLVEQGPAIVLVSLGAQGSYYRCTADGGSLPAYDVKTIDTTGAGDSFLGAVLYRLKDKNLAELKSISKDELANIIDFANAAGSLTTTRKGAIPALPSSEEIAFCVKNTGKL